MKKDLINHIVFVVDGSGSMRDLSDTVIQVFDGEIAHLAERSKELSQETRVSVYLFADSTACLVWDKDVLRLPSLRTLYKAAGQTALMDATAQAIDDLQRVPELYCDHAFLAYVLTDGEENRSRKISASGLRTRITDLPENWTVAALVPNERGREAAKQFGFPTDNIQVWETTEGGVRKVGGALRQATESYMQARATGTRGTRSLFALDAAKLSKTAVRKNLVRLDATDYSLFPVHRSQPIKEFVESWTQAAYRPGSAYFLLTKPETIQAYKQLCVQEKATGHTYSGIAARQLLGLPDVEIKVAPGGFADYDIFVQSTSVNRKLVPGTKLIVLK